MWTYLPDKNWIISTWLHSDSSSSITFLVSFDVTATTISIHKGKIYKTSFYEMADKILESITYIKSVSKKKTSLDKILAHLCKSDDENESWSPEVLNSMISENIIGLVDGVYKIKPNQNKNVTNDQSFVKDTQNDSLVSSLSPMFIQLETTIIPESQGNTRVYF